MLWRLCWSHAYSLRLKRKISSGVSIAMIAGKAYIRLSVRMLIATAKFKYTDYPRQPLSSRQSLLGRADIIRWPPGYLYFQQAWITHSKSRLVVPAKLLIYVNSYRTERLSALRIPASVNTTLVASSRCVGCYTLLLPMFTLSCRFNQFKAKRILSVSLRFDLYSTR